MQGYSGIMAQTPRVLGAPMPFGITERDVERVACCLASSRMIEQPQLPAPSWMGLARRILEEVERGRNRDIEFARLAIAKTLAE